MVGQEIPPFRRVTTLTTWNRYAAVNDEFVSFHMDEAAALAAGLPGAIGMGNLQLAYLHNLLRDWLGEHGRILRIACQYRAYNRLGDTLICRGRVVSVRDDHDTRVADLDVWVENQTGEIITPGSATVVVSVAK